MTKENVNKTEILKLIKPVSEKAAQESGLLEVETVFLKEASKWTVKIYIYNPRSSVTHEDCEKITQKLAPCLDEIIPVPYCLEVSSPGTERKLKSKKEYEIFKGERVKVKLKKTTEKDIKVFPAKIRDYKEDEGLILEMPDGTELKIKNEDISSVKLEPEYNFKSKNK